jgi:type I restriction enzyme, S subunit
MAMGEWRKYKVAEIALPDGVAGGPFGSELVRSDYVPFGVPVIRGVNLGSSDQRFGARDFVFVSPEKADALARNLAIPGDIVVTQRGTLGQVGLVPQIGFDRFVISQSQMRLRCDPKKADPRFIYYCLLHPETIQYIKANAVAAGVPHINLGFFRAMQLLLPSLQEQHVIAQILSTLDDKIELNRQMNETLEAMARALFKSWFVDFDPVRCKAENRHPIGMDAETAKLFPTEFEESELGKVPKGWCVTRLGELLELKRGYDLPSSQRSPGKVPIISSSGLSGTHNESKVNGPGIVTGRYGTIGKVFYVRENFWPLNTTLYAHNLNGNDLLYAYHQLELIDFEKYSDKAAVPGINRNHLHEERLVLPPLALQQRFGSIARSWIEFVAKNNAQASTLASLRDTLLPQLLSGELTIRDAAHAVEMTD